MRNSSIRPSLASPARRTNWRGIARRYGVFYARQPVETAGGGYVVDHTSDTYVVGTDGKLVGKIAHAAPPEQVAAEIRKRLTKP